MTKKILLIVCVLLLSGPAFAKKADITLSGSKNYKPQNQKILTKAWTQSLRAGGPKKRYYPEVSSPVLDGAVLYVGTHGSRFYAVNAANGKVSWAYENDEPISSTARVAAGRVYFTDLGGRVIALNQADGTLVWKQDLGREMLGQPLVLGERLYLLKGEQTVVALSTASGSVVWEKFIRTYLRDITMRGHSAVESDGGSLFVGLGDGHLYNLSASSGDILWDKNLTLPLRTFKDIDARVLIEGDSLYVGGYFGAVYKLNKRSGATLWSTEVATGVPALIHDDVVVVSDVNGTLVGLDKNDGSRLWANELNNAVLSTPVNFGDKIFVSTFQESAYLISPEDGNQIQQLAVGDGAITEPVVDGQNIYLLTNSAALMALKQK